jgi:cyclic pyranopterin phosphate synthase
MVDVSAKPPTPRRAVAEAFVSLGPETLSLVIDGRSPKGDVMSVAELAGVMGGKKTSELIPLCHPLALTDLLVTVTPDRAAGGLRIRAEAATVGPTGVEMEALTAASVAALTAYDMVKASSGGSRSARSTWSRSPVARAASGTDSRAPESEAPRPRRPGERVAGRHSKERLSRWEMRITPPCRPGLAPW